MTKLIVIAIIVALAVYLVVHLRKRTQRKLETEAAGLLEASKGKEIRITDRLSGEDLGVMENRHFEKLLEIFARETGDVSSFYFLAEIFPVLVEEEKLSDDLVEYLQKIIGDKEDVDLVWSFEPRT